MKQDTERVVAGIEEALKHMVMREDFVRFEEQIKSIFQSLEKKLSDVIEHDKRQANEMIVIKNEHEAMKDQLEDHTKRLAVVENYSKEMLDSRLWKWGNSKLFWYSVGMTVGFVLLVASALGVPQAARLLNDILDGIK